MRPVLDPAEDQHIVWESPEQLPSNQKWPLGPLRWVHQADGTSVAVAVGSMDGRERREKVATFYPDNREGYQPPELIQPVAQPTKETYETTSPLNSEVNHVGGNTLVPQGQAEMPVLNGKA